MRPLLLTAVAAGALVAGVAFAQTPPPPGGPDGGPPPGEMRGGYGPGGFGHGFMRPRPMPPKAAFFRFRKGDSSVTVKCADDEPTKACTDAVQAMLQAINASPAPAR